MKKIGILKSFFISMLSGSPEVSSKRIIGVSSFIAVLIVVFKVLFAKYQLHNEILIRESLNTLFLIIAATVLGGTIENVMKSNKGVNIVGTKEPEHVDKEEE